MPNSVIELVEGLEPGTVHLLRKNDFNTAKDILFSSTTDLMELLDISHTQAVNLQRVVSAHTCPVFSTVQ